MRACRWRSTTNTSSVISPPVSPASPWSQIPCRRSSTRRSERSGTRTASSSTTKWKGTSRSTVTTMSASTAWPSKWSSSSCTPSGSTTRTARASRPCPSCWRLFLFALISELPFDYAQDGISNTFTIIPNALGKDEVFMGDLDLELELDPGCCEDNIAFE